MRIELLAVKNFFGSLAIEGGALPFGSGAKKFCSTELVDNIGP